MKKIAFLFPGQGSQAPGMGRDAATRSAEAASLMARANDILGFDLRGMCFDGPEDELKKTQNTQPALYLASAATLAVLAEAGIRPHAVAGHSLGEYTALYAAGVFDFETGLRLVRLRGEEYARAGDLRPGAMAAILGLDAAKVEELCAGITEGGIVVPANYNEPTQTVVSGDPAAVTALCEAAKAAGAKRALPLPVSGAFHSPLVAPAADAMRTALAGATITAPGCVFVNNVDAKELSQPEAIRESLVRQITGPVRWVACLEALVAAGAEAFLEVGSGKVLSGMAGRRFKDVPCFNTNSAAEIDKAIAALG